MTVLGTPGKLRELPVPDFYQADRARQWSYAPDQQALFLAAQAWRREHAVRPSAQDRKRVQLLLIDLQKDFCFPRGSLYVGGRSGAGAMDDSDRIARFLYRNLELITDVTCTLDTHFPFQIFSPAFWLGEDGQAPAPHQEITVEMIRGGKVRPNPDIAWWLSDGDYAWLERQVEFYCRELEQAGKYKLYLWPPHCILGSDGHPLAGVIHEARLFHAWARGAKSWIESKGDQPLTENYSVLAPEVLLRFDGRPLAHRNAGFIQTLLRSDAVIIAGQAASHCVKNTIDDLLGETAAHGEALARKIYILRDCMSSVAVPDPQRPGSFLFDFTPQAEAALDRFAAAGMHVVSSEQAMAEWPEMGL
jgi:nicotinamidase-related amidase